MLRFFDRTGNERPEEEEEWTDEQWQAWSAMQQARAKRQRVANASDQAYDARCGYAETYYSRTPTPPATAPPGYVAVPSPTATSLATYIDDNGVLYTGPSGLKLAPPQYAAPPPQYAAPTPQYAAPTPQYAAPPPQYAAPKQYVEAPTAYTDAPLGSPPLPPPNFAPPKYIARPQHPPQPTQYAVGPSAAAAGPHYTREPSYKRGYDAADDDRYDRGSDKGKGKTWDDGKGFQKMDKGGDKGHRAYSSSAEGKGASSSEWNEDIQKYQKTGWLNKCSDLVTLVLRGESARAHELAKFYANSSSMFPLLPSDVKNSL